MPQTNKGYLTAKTTAQSDECLTPKYAVEPIIKYLQAKNYKTIWCPFDEDHSWYVRLLRNYGFNVINTHLFNGQDFFQYTPNQHYDCIVSNLPFSLKDKVIERLYALNKPFAMLMPQNTLQSTFRTPLFIKNGIEYLGFDKRISFYINGDLSKPQKGTAFASGYFCKDVLPDKLVLEEIEIKDEPYDTSI